VPPQLKFHLCRDDKDIRLNFEELKFLDNEITQGYHDWANKAPEDWKADDFLQGNTPIIITSRFGQNAAIAVLGNEEHESQSWDLQRDYSKIAFLTFALATSIE
jgi:hypothetical protein